MRVSMLIENETIDQRLFCEHGLALYIEAAGVKILFDTGASGAFINNAAAMGIDLTEVDWIIISHSHYDHGGGLAEFLELNTKAKVYMSANAGEQYYAKLLGFKRKVGLSANLLSKYHNRIEYVEDFTKISDSMFLVTKFGQRHPRVKTINSFASYTDGGWVVDQFTHEMVLAIKNDGKLIVFTGCSHSGIENIVETVMKCFPGEFVDIIIGGLHAPDFPQGIYKNKQILTMGENLANYSISKIYTCHCTGKKAYHILKKAKSNMINYFCTGMQIEL